MIYSPDIKHEYELCAHDPTYFISKYCKIYTIDSGLSTFLLHNHQENIATLFKSHEKIVISHARQTGVSITIAALVLWYALFKDQQQILVLNPCNNHAIQFMQLIHNMVKHLPDWINGVLFNNRHNIEFLNGSKIISSTATACSVCGVSASLLVMHDVAFFRELPVVVDSIRPALGTSGRLLISSNFGMASKFCYDFCQSVVKSGGAYVHVPWTVHTNAATFEPRMKETIGEACWNKEYEATLWPK